MHIAYVTYANNFLTHSDHKNLIAFDGYGQSSTKDHANVQRSPKTSLEIVIHEGTIFDSKNIGIDTYHDMVVTN